LVRTLFVRPESAGAAPIAAGVIATAVAAVARPFPLSVVWQTWEASPQAPVLALTVARVSAAVTFAEPLKDGDVHVASPVIPMVRPVVRVAALPVVDWFHVGTVPVRLE
jgi:hypothetical protein